MRNLSRITGGVLLISGTSIGAGLLALPVETGHFGFLPSTLILTLCWLTTLFAAFYMLEANLWLPHDANLISMAEETLGKPGKIISWVAYLLLLYALMVAYLSGMSGLLTDSLASQIHVHLSRLQSSLVLIGVFGSILYISTKSIDYLNRVLIIGFAGCLFAMVFSLAPQLQPHLLKHAQYSNIWLSLPVLVTTFGYQIVIPSVRRYLHSDTRHLVIAVIIGSTIPLLTYVLWELVILGVIPAGGHHGLDSILANGNPATGLTTSLQNILHADWISNTAKFLSFFVIATSFIGVSLSLFDFLFDGFHSKRTHTSRLIVALITFIPPVLITISYQGLFMAALGYAGILVSVLLIILPVLMVISGRYFRNEPAHFRTPGGLFSILLLLAFALVVICTEILQHM